MRNKTRQGTRGLRHALLIAGVGAGYACWAGPADFTPYAEYGVSADNNLFRLDDGGDSDNAGDGDRRRAKSDTVRHASVGVLVDWPVSRQTVHVAASASDYDYQRFDQLDHSENEIDTALDYNLGQAVSGTARYENVRRLEDFSNRDSTDPDFMRRQRIEIDNRVEITPNWRLRTRVGHLRLDHSLNTERRFDRREDDVLVAVEYVGSADSVAGVGVEHVDGKFPGREADDMFARSFDQNEAFDLQLGLQRAIQSRRAAGLYPARQRRRRRPRFLGADRSPAVSACADRQDDAERATVA